MAPSADTGTVNRILRILSAFAARERWPLNELARHLQLPRASTHRLLSLCKPLGYVEQDENSLYVAGIELYRVAGTLAMAMPINRLAAPVLETVRDATGETAALVLLARPHLQLFFSHLASPAHPLRYAVELNRLQPLPWGSAGQSLLAFLKPDEIDLVLAREESSPLDGRTLDAGAVRASLEEVRARGYAKTYSERAPDMHGLSVPFFDGVGEVRGNITMTIPQFRFDESLIEKHVALLRQAVAELTRRLGWQRD